MLNMKIENQGQDSRQLDRSDIEIFHYNGVVVEVYRDLAFRNNKEALVSIITELYSKIFLRPDEAKWIVEQNMRREDAHAALVRKKNATFGNDGNYQYDGFASGNKFVLTIGEGESEGKINVGYSSNRALSPELREHGLGTFLYELFPFIVASPTDMIFHRFGSPVPAWSAIKAGVYRYGYYPLGDGKTAKPYSSNPLVRDTAYALYPHIRRYSRYYSPDTGLSKGEYKQPGKAYLPVYEPIEDHEPTMRILGMMERFGFRLKEGDALIGGGLNRPMEQIFAEQPQLLQRPDFAALAKAS